MSSLLCADIQSVLRGFVDDRPVFDFPDLRGTSRNRTESITDGVGLNILDPAPPAPELVPSCSRRFQLEKVSLRLLNLGLFVHYLSVWQPVKVNHLHLAYLRLSSACDWLWGKPRSLFIIIVIDYDTMVIIIISPGSLSGSQPEENGPKLFPEMSPGSPKIPGDLKACPCF